MVQKLFGKFIYSLFVSNYVEFPEKLVYGIVAMLNEQ